MLRRIAPTLLMVGAVLAACGGAALTDPKQIITQGLDATGNLKSFHVTVAVSGSLPQAAGSSISLTGTTLEGDVATDGSAHLTFAIPTLLGLTGEVLVIDKDMYIKTTLTGPKWSHQAAPAASPDASGASASAPAEAKAMVEKLKTFLEKDGVTSTKLEDVDCAAGKCYHVQVTIPSTLLKDQGARASMDPAAMFGDSVVMDLWFATDKLYLTKMSMTGSAATADTFSLIVNFSAFDEEVTVSPPPASEVQEGGFNLPGGLPGLPGLGG